MEHCDYIKENFRPQSCLLTAIINKFYNRFNKIKSDGFRRNKELTYDYLCELLEIPNKPSQNGVTLQVAIDKFFKKFNFTGLYVYDYYMKLIYKHEADDDDRCVLRIMYKDQHVYELNDNLKSLEQKVNYDDDERDSLIVSSKYNILEKNSEAKEVFCDDMDSILNEIKETSKNEKINQLKIISSFDITKILFNLLSDGYTPKVGFSTHLYRISLLIDKLQIIIVKSDNNPEKGQIISFNNLE